MKLGMIGLPNVGKSTLFNAITNAGAQAANYPFCTIEPNVGIVAVPEPRLDKLAEIYQPEKYTPATVEFVDIAGLVKGAAKGEGLGNKFLANIREVDALIHVVRCFNDDNVIHVDGSVNAGRDIEVINLELIFSDIEILDRRIARVEKDMKGDRSLADELALLKRLHEHLEEGKSARAFSCDDEEKEIINALPLLSNKPIIYAANTHGDERIHDMIGRLKREGLGADEINELIEFAKRHGGIDYAERTMQDYRKKALDLLPEGIEEDIRKAITSYIDVVINRKK